MKKKIILGIIIGIVVGGLVGIKAATTIQSSQVLYEDKKLDVILDELFKELIDGKEKLATSITNKGVETTSDNTLEEMASNIDSLANLMYDKGKEDERTEILNNISISTKSYSISHTFYGAGSYFDYTITDFDAVASGTAIAGCINVGNGSSTGSATLTVTVLNANTVRVNCVALPDSSRTHGGVKLTVTGVNVN